MFCAMIAVFSVAAMFLWNALMPGIFGLPVLSYWQAAGLVVLARILFGGLGPGRFAARGGDGHLFSHGNALREKWLNMSDDERMEFVRKNRGGFPYGHIFGENGNGKKDEGGKSE